MRKVMMWVICVATGLALGAMTIDGASDDQRSTDRQLVDELSTLNDTLREIRDLMEGLRNYQRGTLFVRRIEIERRHLDVLEQELRDRLAEQQRVRDEWDALVRMVGDEEEIREDIAADFTRRLQNAQTTVDELEDEIIPRREKLEQMDEAINEVLEER